MPPLEFEKGGRSIKEEIVKHWWGKTDHTS